MAALPCLACSERRTLTPEVGYAVGHNSSPQLARRGTAAGCRNGKRRPMSRSESVIGLLDWPQPRAGTELNVRWFH